MSSVFVDFADKGRIDIEGGMQVNPTSYIQQPKGWRHDVPPTL